MSNNYFSEALQRVTKVRKRGKQVKIPVVPAGNGHPNNLNTVRDVYENHNILSGTDLNLQAIREALVRKLKVLVLVQSPFKPGTNANSVFVEVEKLSDRRDEVTFIHPGTGKRMKMPLVNFMMAWFGHINGTELKGYGVFLKKRESQKRKAKPRSN